MRANVATAVVLLGAAGICLGGEATGLSTAAIIVLLLVLLVVCFLLDRWVMGW